MLLKPESASEDSGVINWVKSSPYTNYFHTHTKQTVSSLFRYYLAYILAQNKAMKTLFVCVYISIISACIKPAPLPPNIIIEVIDENKDPVVGAYIATGTKFFDPIGISLEPYQIGVTDEKGEFLAYRSHIPEFIMINKEGFCDSSSPAFHAYDEHAVAITIEYKRKSLVQVKLAPSSQLNSGEQVVLYNYFGNSLNDNFIFSSHNDLFQTEVCVVDNSNKIEFRLESNGNTLSRNSTSFHVPAGDTTEVFLHF